MNNDEFTLQNLLESIQKELDNISAESFVDALSEQLEIAKDKYELDNDQSHYLLMQFVAMEEQGATKTLINAKKASEIILKRKNKK